MDEVFIDLGLDQQPVDPTAMSQEQLVGEIQRIIKALLGYGARLPKILMLYVKNLMFLDGAIARLAPDLDILSEFANLSVHMATNFADHIAADMGVDASDIQVDPEAIKAGLGIHDPEVTQLTYADLQARRDVIRRRLTGQ
jgi:ubiquinone biosynthesis protein